MPIAGNRRVSSRYSNPGFDIKDPSLVLYLPLYYPDSETTGSPIISKDINRHSCTVTGTTWGSQGRTLDGDDYIELTSSAMDFTTSPFTICAWVKTTNLTAHNSILCRGLTNTDGYYFDIYSGGLLRLRTSQAGVNQESNSDSGTILTNVNYFVSAVRSGSSVRIYRNGIDITNAVGTHINPVTSARTVKLGVYDDKAYAPLKGTMGEVLVYSRALSDSEIRQRYQVTKWRYM